MPVNVIVMVFISAGRLFIDPYSLNYQIEGAFTDTLGILYDQGTYRESNETQTH